MKTKLKTIGKCLLILILLCVFAWSSYQLYSYADEYDKLSESYEDAQDLVQIETLQAENEVKETTAPTESNIEPNETESTEPIDEYKDLKVAIDIDWESLKSQSKDVVGWLYVPDSNMNYPLVHRDNEYYLNHDYKGSWNSGGAIFLDEQVTLDSKNVIIYGHHMKSDIMFHRLPNYTKQDYADSHKYIYISTKDETRIYQVFSVVYTRGDSNVYTWDFGGGSEITFGEYIDEAIADSVVDTDALEISEDDVIISLSTCSGRSRIERIVVRAVMITTY